MISKTIKSIAMVAIVFATLNFVSCKRDNDNTVEDAQAAAVAEQFVDNTVAPTYTALAAKAEQLASQLAALKANPTNAGVREACETFLAAREQWEMSEAFLFGAAGDFGIDPHIDSWPLDEDAFNTLMNSPAMIEALDSEDGDAVAGDRLGNALLGFHGIEYILFANGQPKADTETSDSVRVHANIDVLTIMNAAGPQYATGPGILQLRIRAHAEVPGEDGEPVKRYAYLQAKTNLYNDLMRAKLITYDRDLQWAMKSRDHAVLDLSTYYTIFGSSILNKSQNIGGIDVWLETGDESDQQLEL